MKRPARSLVLLVAVLVVLWLLTGLVCQPIAEWLWFAEVGYLQVFWARLLTQASSGTIVALLSLAFLLSHLRLAQRWRQPVHLQIPDRPSLRSRPDPSTPSSPLALSLGWLLPIALGLSGLLLLVLLHAGQTIVSSTASPDLLDRVPLLPDRFVVTLVQWLTQHLNAPTPALYLGIGGAAVGLLGLLLYPLPGLKLGAIGLGVGWGWIVWQHWGRILLGLYATPFDRTEPLFNQDIGFYVFFLPLWELLECWLLAVGWFGLAGVALVYLLAGNSLSQGRFAGFSEVQQRHLAGLAGALLAVGAVGHWLNRYELLYSTRGVTYGASYTDVQVSLPTHTGLSVLAGTIALVLMGWALRNPSQKNSRRSPKFKPHSSRVFWLLPLYAAIALSSTQVLPIVVQRLVVQPNELAREEPYIRRSITLTREAFDLEAIEVENFNPQNTLTARDLETNALTIRNIRLWDTRPLLETNRQLQQIRPYYRFADADIDRYTLLTNTQQTGNQPADNQQTTQQTNTQPSEKQQVLISARELDYAAVPKEAQTWVNEHLVYTHGYGFTLSPVNRVVAGGLPDYFVKDIGTEDATGGLTVSDDRIRASIPIGHPRLYYGELTHTYIMTGTRVQELDYPSGSDNVYNTYDGTGGIAIASGWRRWVFARYLHDWQMLLTNNFTSQSKLLFRRTIQPRIRAIAPFLQFDQDPYLVAADAGGETNPKNYLYWIVDAYTTSDRYPYSDPGGDSGESVRPFNYIRNSVKVVVDAYNGSVAFYIADASDPLIQTWARIFPGMFRSLDTLPAQLQTHIRYPSDLFSVQAERLMTYHMTDPQVFYNREDQWQIPTEIYGNQPKLVEPYYLITKLATEESEEFILLLPYTPNQRTNLTAWLAARSDGGNYGKLLVYVFPKQQLVYGTEQIEARINQDPVISQQISLWNRQGSRALQGNLLVIPIAQSLLYVEPLYLEAEQNSLPTLVRVIVAYENRIVMAETLEKALQAIFQPDRPETPAIVRPVESGP